MGGLILINRTGHRSTNTTHRAATHTHTPTPTHTGQQTERVRRPTEYVLHSTTDPLMLHILCAQCQQCTKPVALQPGLRGGFDGLHTLRRRKSPTQPPSDAPLPGTKDQESSRLWTWAHVLASRSTNASIIDCTAAPRWGGEPKVQRPVCEACVSRGAGASRDPCRRVAAKIYCCTRGEAGLTHEEK